MNASDEEFLKEVSPTIRATPEHTTHFYDCGCVSKRLLSIIDGMKDEIRKRDEVLEVAEKAFKRLQVWLDPYALPNCDRNVKDAEFAIETLSAIREILGKKGE